ncbi:MAG: hypothetical protein HSCHL_1547 [Hydrogenibacillus schlegelii]|uniref:Replicative helicase inhibitor G39P N-terminal domain-containing protein n=1 Tax=Hydrogenibacillus schlegelii TaxID=1484 RepID=A0A2T5G4E3_HYDSH|nr:hypothetical protein [Hydrogenibacillus schlegelii]PTQ51056.1 MAG: hypothetical protein HSCHL_1547 [Hydrogenibacillus schlegelii]
MNFDEALKLATLAAASFPNMQGKDLRPIAYMWSQILPDVPYAVAERALMRHLSGNAFFPTPAELRAAVYELAFGDLPSAAEAWAAVIRAVRKHGFGGAHEARESLPPIVWKAVSAIGWRDICLTDEPEIVRAQFMRVYEALVRRERDERTLPPALRAGALDVDALPAGEAKV